MNNIVLMKGSGIVFLKKHFSSLCAQYVVSLTIVKATYEIFGTKEAQSP